MGSLSRQHCPGSSSVSSQGPFQLGWQWQGQCFLDSLLALLWITELKRRPGRGRRAATEQGCWAKRDRTASRGGEKAEEVREGLK